jgi:type VI protein secretion system component Hcp
VLGVNRLTVALRVVRQYGRTGDCDWMVRAALMDKDHEQDQRRHVEARSCHVRGHGALADTELDAVSGGITRTSFSIQKLVDKATPKLF